MADLDKEEFKFPDEIDNNETENKESDFDIEIEDDTPPEDRGRKPSEPEFVEKLEKDELEEYSDEAKKKIAQFKKIYHDERRAKEEAERERNEAINFTQRLLEENKRVKSMLQSGEEEYKEAKKDQAKLALKAAKQMYKDAYELTSVLRSPIDMLVGSRYEQQYTQALRLCNELVKMLHQRL